MSRFVGRYQIRERIGEGAMAHVYRSHDPSIDRELAIKILKREFSKDQEYAKRFVREAKAAGALSHTNIVTIYDVGAINGFPYIAMELLDGEPLDQVLARAGRLTATHVIEIGLQLANALRYAHEQGVIHRDIKPANIVLCDGGRTIKILDFGIARLSGGDDGDPELVRTQIGQVIGTPRYMSPEQALGQSLDGRSDLFAVGAVLYELITGRHAFTGDNLTTLAMEIVQNDPRPITELAPDCPPGLRFIIEKLLAKKPDKRFASGTQLMEALERERAQSRAALDEVKNRRRYLPVQARFALMLAAATAVVLSVSIGAVLTAQYRAMERVAVASGASIVTFVAANVAVQTAENAVLPEERQDWLPVQAFVTNAANDPTVTTLTVVDARGVVRASTDPISIGRPHIAARGEPIVSRRTDLTVAEASSVHFRFRRPITYAGRVFGMVDLTLSREDLVAAARLSAWLMLALGAITFATVVAISYAVARLLAQPIRRLRKAMDAGAAGDLDFRLSHLRKDEFGELFDAFNGFIAAMQQRLEAPAAPPPRSIAMDATRITPPAANEIAPAKRAHSA